MARRLSGAAATAAAAAAIKVQELLEYAISQPEGFTRLQAEKYLEWTPGVLDNAVRGLRRFLNFDGDRMTLTCVHSGKAALYSLVGQPEDVQAYAAVRFLTFEKQFDTLSWMMAAVSQGLRADSPERKRADLYQTHLGRLQEDLTNLRNGLTLF